MLKPHEWDKKGRSPNPGKYYDVEKATEELVGQEVANKIKKLTLEYDSMVMEVEGLRNEARNLEVQAEKIWKEAEELINTLIYPVDPSLARELKDYGL